MENKGEFDAKHQERTKNALMRYLLILFAVAFILVLLSFVLQTRNTNTTINELSKTSSSALSNAEQLQSTNQYLTEENSRLNEEIRALESQLTETETELSVAKNAREMAVQEKENAVSSATDDYNRLKAEQQEQEIIHVLFSDAETAYLTEDQEALTEALSQLSSYLDSMTEKDLMLYRLLSAVEFPEAKSESKEDSLHS